LGTHELVLVIRWIIDVVIISIVVVFVIHTSCTGALHSVNRCPLACTVCHPWDAGAGTCTSLARMQLNL
jgi:hypothetical protein